MVINYKGKKEEDTIFIKESQCTSVMEQIRAMPTGVDVGRETLHQFCQVSAPSAQPELDLEKYWPNPD